MLHNFILWLNYLAGPVGIIMTIVVIVLAMNSIRIARRSFREAERTRRDMFLPIILVEGIPSSGIAGQLRIRNLGQGVAFDTKAYLPGTNVKEFAKVFPPSRDVIASANFRFPDQHILNEPLLIIEYFDVFGRKVKTTYEIQPEEQQSGLYYPRVKLETRTIRLP